MPNIRLTIEYDGSGFHGWQKQPNLRTIQEELEKVLETVLREPVGTLHASGRTDAGVHARGQVVNFSVPIAPDLDRLLHSVSSIMKGELSVLSAEVVPDDFHSCYDAVCKQYTYTLLRRSAPAVLNKGQAWHISSPLDIDLMEEEALACEGEHDFSSFRGAGCDNKNPVKTIYVSEITAYRDLIYYRIIGTGFLKQMVRNIVGTLVEMGRGRSQVGSVHELLALKDRTKAGPTAPAGGLCLDWVRYEE